MTGRALVLAILAAGLAITAPAHAGEARVIAAEAKENGDGTFRVSATVEHADEGWDHYANAFEVIGPEGEVLGTRVLAHPHVTEQPFTRTLGRVAVPEGVARVSVRAVDSVHGPGSEGFALDLPGRASD